MATEPITEELAGACVDANGYAQRNKASVYSAISTRNKSTSVMKDGEGRCVRTELPLIYLRTWM